MVLAKEELRRLLGRGRAKRNVLGDLKEGELEIGLNFGLDE